MSQLSNLYEDKVRINQQEDKRGMEVLQVKKEKKMYVLKNPELKKNIMLLRNGKKNCIFFFCETKIKQFNKRRKKHLGSKKCLIPEILQKDCLSPPN